VGGPGDQDDYQDSCSDYTKNEVTTGTLLVFLFLSFVVGGRGIVAIASALALPLDKHRLTLSYSPTKTYTDYNAGFTAALGALRHLSQTKQLPQNY